MSRSRPSRRRRPRRCSPFQSDSNGPSAWARDASRRGRAFFASTRVCTACQPPHAAGWSLRNTLSSQACETRTRGCQRRSRVPQAVDVHGRPPHAPRARHEHQSQGLRERQSRRTAAGSSAEIGGACCGKCRRGRAWGGCVEARPRRENSASAPWSRAKRREAQAASRDLEATMPSRLRQISFIFVR